MNSEIDAANVLFFSVEEEILECDSKEKAFLRGMLRCVNANIAGFACMSDDYGSVREELVEYQRMLKRVIKSALNKSV